MAAGVYGSRCNTARAVLKKSLMYMPQSALAGGFRNLPRYARRSAGLLFAHYFDFSFGPPIALFLGGVLTIAAFFSKFRVIRSVNMIE